MGSVSRIALAGTFRGLLAFLCKHLAQPVEFFAHLLGPLCGSVAGFDGLKLVERLLGALQSGRFGFHRLLSSGRLHEFVGEFVQCLGQLLLGLLLLGLEAWLVGAKFRGLLEVVQRLAQLHGLLLRLGKGRLLLLEIPLVFMDLGHTAVDLLAGALGLLMVWGLLQSVIDLFTGHSQ